MSQTRRAIEQLAKQGKLPIEHVDAATRHLEVYPSKRRWLDFFDKALLIIGAMALVLSLVFFIAYNWQNLGKIGKFALVEGALVLTIALYVALSFQRRFQLIRQLLLLIASVITGSLLALFGQVYQTGADTWQLFFGWALLILPWVVIAHFPALWLLWLGLMNAFLVLYLDVIDLSFINNIYQSTVPFALLALVNFIAINLWLVFVDNQDNLTSSTFNTNRPTPNHIVLKTQSSLHWSTHIVGLVSTITITLLVIMSIFDSNDMLVRLFCLSLWLGWCGFMYWQFYQRRVDLLMLTYLSFSLIIVVMFWVGEWLLDDFETAGFLILALLLIGISSVAVVWLRKVAKSETPAIERGLDHE